jgi:hypothetical protein
VLLFDGRLIFVPNVAWVSLGECRRLLLTLGMMGCVRTKKEKNEQNVQAAISMKRTKLSKL